MSGLPCVHASLLKMHHTLIDTRWSLTCTTLTTTAFHPVSPLNKQGWAFDLSKPSRLEGVDEFPVPARRCLHSSVQRLVEPSYISGTLLLFFLNLDVDLDERLFQIEVPLLTAPHRRRREGDPDACCGWCWRELFLVVRFFYLLESPYYDEPILALLYLAILTCLPLVEHFGPNDRFCFRPRNLLPNFTFDCSPYIGFVSRPPVETLRRLLGLFDVDRLT